MEYQCSVLVVEDDLAWQHNYQEALQDEGYLVVVASTTKEAERRLRERNFDVAIVDLRLVDCDPENKDGVQVVRLIGEIGRSTRTIVKSGYLTEDVHRQLHELGVSGILDKNGTPRELMELVAQSAVTRSTR